MKQLKKYLALIAIFGIANLLEPINSLAQDIHFSQFYTSPLLLNPATAGTADRNYRFTSHYKDQWASMGAPYKTMAGAFDMWFMKNKALCGGLSFYNDKAGDSKMGVTQVNLALSSVQQLNSSNILSAGLQGGYAQHSVDYSQIKWDNQYAGNIYDPGLSSGEPNDVGTQFSNFDFSSGIFWMAKPGQSFKISTGLSYNHIGQPRYSFYELPDEKLYGKFVLHSGAKYDIDNTNTSVLPSILIQKQGPSYEIVAGSLIKYTLGLDSKYTGVNTSSALYLGAHYRVKDALILAFLFDIKQYVTLGVSYDVNLSGLSKATSSRGGMEISLQIPVQDNGQKTSVKLR